MSLFTWLKTPGARGRALERLYADDPAEARAALDILSEEGWLEDGSLRGTDLREANLPEADLSKVDLQEVNFADADLTAADLTEGDFMWADFSRAAMPGAKLINATLIDARFENTDLTNADFTGADVRGARFDGADLTDATISADQLASAAMLFATIMPDGTPYDGRYRLDADEELAATESYFYEDPAQMAEFYDIPIETYERGQAWAAENLDAITATLDAANENTVLKWHDTVEGEPGTPEQDEYEVQYDPDRLEDYRDLIVDTFEDPQMIAAYRRLGNNRQKLLNMGATTATALMWLPYMIGIVLQIYYFLAQIVPVLRQPDRGFYQPLDFVLIPAFFILPLVGFWLTQWSLTRPRATVVTHIAQAVIYYAMWRYGGNLWFTGLLIAGYILSFVTLQAVGTQRGRRLIAILAAVAISGDTPLFRIWNRFIVLELMQRGTFTPFAADGINFTPAYLLVSSLAALLEAALLIYLVRLAVLKWVVPRLGTPEAGTLARRLIWIGIACLILGFFGRSLWPLIGQPIIDFIRAIPGNL
jgi:uncharacterized protein YjbI with pentapeptide repeats